MRLRHALTLTGMLLTFFGRRVLNVGALRLRSVRIAALGCAAVVFVALTLTARQFLAPYASDPEIWGLLFGTSTVSLLLWVMVAFLFIKVLFLNSDGILELSFQLPLTNRERSLAFLVFEAAITLGVAAVTAVPVMTSAVLLVGPSAVGQILTTMLAPILLTYLALSLGHVLATRALSRLRTRAVADVLGVLVIFAVVLLYSSRMTDLIWQVTGPAAEGSFVWPTAVAWLAGRVGTPLALVAVLACCTLLAAAVVALMPGRYVAPARYLDLRLPGRVAARLSPYDWCFLRSQHTFTGSVVGLALYGYLLLETDLNPLWSLCTLTIGGLYLFSATAPLREMTGHRQPASRVYLATLRPQLLLMAAFGIPAAVPAAVLGRLGDLPVVLLGALISATLMTCIGVIFPTEKDNPLAAFVGLSALVVVLVLIALGLEMLDIPVPAGLLGATALLVFYAIQGVRHDERRRRNEGGTAGHQRGRGRGAPHAGARRPVPAVPHVLRG